MAEGYARAVTPVTAATMVTDTEGLDAGPIRIAAADIEIPGYFAMPENGKALPVVLVVQEIFGLHEHIRDVCRRLAKQGYLAVAAEMYVRQGDPSGIADIPTILSRVVSKVPDAQVMADLDAAVGWAEQSGRAEVARLGITGFCWGGRIVWLYCAHSSQVKAGVAWYGRVVGDRDALRPRHPVDVGPELKAPVLGLYGAQDQGIPPATVEPMRAFGEIVMYADAGHGFFGDYRPGYVESAAKDGWRRMLEWFRRHGV
jgi:carboxymethylenebutenolidase